MTEPVPLTETVRFPVAGMTCGSCVNRITKALRKLDGVTRVGVDLRNETATVRREPGRVSNAALVAAVADAGYEADLTSAVLIPAGQPRSLLGWLYRRTR